VAGEFLRESLALGEEILRREVGGLRTEEGGLNLFN
jgi:hypothetical protein